MESSLIIATYNWPQALNLCLQSVLQQSLMPAEIIIADDGSGLETEKIILKYKKLFACPLIHLWHKDEGFRLAQIRNKAVAVSKEYVIQIDGDLILHKDFVKNHVQAATPSKYICGSRVILNEAITNLLIKRSSKKNSFGFFNKNISNRFNSLYLKWLSNFINAEKNYNNIASIRGCNMSYWRNDFIAVNGYNEAFIGWGREDSELIVRFNKLGLKRRYFKFQGIVYHLYHKENERTSLTQNDILLEQAKQQLGYRCVKGINQYL